MPRTSPNDKVLVTGANGFIARWIVKDLLEHGFSVRATVRSLEKANDIKPIFAPTYGDRLEFAVIDDFTAVSPIPVPCCSHHLQAR